MLHADRRAAKIERQAKVAACRLSGQRSQVAIARALGVDPATIHRDFRALDAEWRAQAAAATAAMKGLHLDRLEALIRGLWADASRGTWPAVDRVLGCLDREAKLFGLDAPSKIDITQRVRETATALGLDP